MAADRRGRTRRDRIVALLLGLALLTAGLLVVVGSASPAKAHGLLESSSPATGAVETMAPATVSLLFNEGVELRRDAVLVLDPRGDPVHRGKAEFARGSDTRVEIPLKSGLMEGTYTVAWRVVSADSHAISGAYTFSVGKRSPTAVDASALRVRGDPVVRWVYDTLRGVAFAAFALLTGAGAFLLLCRPEGGGRTWARRLAIGGWSGVLLSAMGLVALYGPYGEGLELTSVWERDVLSRTLDSKLGRALSLRVLLLAPAAAFLMTLLRPGGPPGRWIRAGGALLVLGLAATWSVTGHAGAGREEALFDVPVAVPMDSAHLVAIAFWLGGLACLLPALRTCTAATAERFSRLAQWCVAVMVLTGLYASWRQLGTWSDLTGTSYGRLLLIKASLVAVVLAVAFFSRRAAQRMRAAADALDARESAGDPEPAGGPDAPGATRVRKGLRRSVLTEVVVSVAVVAVTAALTGTAPAREEARTRQAGPQDTAMGHAARTVSRVRLPFDTGGPGGRGEVSVGLSPGVAGRNEVGLLVFGTDGQLKDVSEATVRFALPERGIGRLDVPLVHQGTGRYTGQQAQLSVAGRWQVTVTVRTSDIDQREVTGQITVRPAGN